MYARGVDSLTFTVLRPEPRRSSIPRRLGIGLGLILFVIFGMSKVVEGGIQPGYTTIAVAPGQTLWQIASSRYPDADARQEISQIMSVNNLSSPIVYPGERLRVPNQ